MGWRSDMIASSKMWDSDIGSMITKSKVAVVFTTPGNVLDDVKKAMLLADYPKFVARNNSTLLKVNTSWQYYYPACSTTPWQMDGVIRTLKHDDYEDIIRLTQTYLEQIAVNQKFRDIVKFFQTITYNHFVPSLFRHTNMIRGIRGGDDPYGQDFLENMARENERTRRARLSRIEQVLKLAVPRIEHLEFIRDQVTGQPHLQVLYPHWRPRAGIQQEDQLSDGTLRLIGILWSLLDGDSLLMLEEPELNLHSGIVKQLAAIILRVQQNTGRQVLISTHNPELLADSNVNGQEVLLLKPILEGSEAFIVTEVSDAFLTLERDAVEEQLMINKTRTENLDQLNLFE